MSHTKRKLEEIVENDEPDFNRDGPGKQPPRLAGTCVFAVIFGSGNDEDQEA